jgi:hypothetical protein
MYQTWPITPHPTPRRIRSRYGVTYATYLTDPLWACGLYGIVLKYHSDNDQALIDSSKPMPLGFNPNIALAHLLKSRIIFIGLKFYPFMTTQVLWCPRFLINPNGRSNLLTMVKSWSPWVLTSKTSQTNPNDTLDQVNTHLWSNFGQRHGQTLPKP